MSDGDAGGVLRYALKGKNRHVKMSHYPKGDRIDAVTGAQYFYHAHRENFDTQEHGHFHCFLRTQFLPARLKPLPLPPPAAPAAAPMTHLVAIAMNRHSRPIRLFTVNRWVASDDWFDARRMPSLLKRFQFSPPGDPYWTVLDGWVAGMLHLFAPQITWLAVARDRAIAARRTSHPDRDPYDDHRLEELSELPVDLERQVAWLTG